MNEEYKPLKVAKQKADLAWKAVEAAAREAGVWDKWVVAEARVSRLKGEVVDALNEAMGE